MSLEGAARYPTINLGAERRRFEAQEQEDEAVLSRRNFMNGATAVMGATSVGLFGALMKKESDNRAARNAEAARAAAAFPTLRLEDTGPEEAEAYAKAWSENPGDAADAAANDSDDVSAAEVADLEAAEAPASAEVSGTPYAVPRELVGKSLGGLEGAYLGPRAASGPLPAMLPPIAFDKNIRAMLKEKNVRVAKAKDARTQTGVYNRLADSYESLWKRGQVRKMNLPAFKQLVQKESYSMLSALDGRYGALAHTYFRPALDKAAMKPDEAQKTEDSIAKMLGYLAQHITPEVQLAYLATEIMPAPEKGAALLSFLMEHAGVEFIERIPALGDRELSYGPFQLTPYVIGEEGSVSNMLDVIKKPGLVPSDLTKFSSIEDHLHAGFLFGVENLMSLMQDAVKGKRYDELITLCESASTGSALGRSTVFLEYLAAAHHRPLVAREAMQDWLAKNKHLPLAFRSKTLVNSFDNGKASQEVKAYAQKAQQHFMHILRYLARAPQA